MITDIIKEISNDKNVNIQEYINVNLSSLVNLPVFINNINSIDSVMLFNILNFEDIDDVNIFIIINNINYATTVKLLHCTFSNYLTFNIESILLIKLLNYKNLYTLCCSNKPFPFIKQYNTMSCTISQLKEIYIFVYNENIKYKCLRSKDFIVIIQQHYFKFNVSILLSKLKQLLNVLEYIFNFHSVYYEEEKEFRNLRCKNLQEHMFYEENFNSFVGNYRANNKITDIMVLCNDESIGNIDDILRFLFIND
jgi:hypothetical protein